MISPRHIKAALFAAAEKDVRYYLNGVYVEFGFDHTISVATDDHILAAFRQAVSPYDMPPELIGQSFIIPRDVCAQIAKVKAPSMAVTLAADRWLQFDAPGVSVRGRAIDGKFPDWRRVAPRAVSPRHQAQINPDLLAKFSGIARALGSKAFPTLWSTGDERSEGALRVAIPDFDEEFVGALMPLRGNVAVGKPGTWYL